MRPKISVLLFLLIFPGYLLYADEFDGGIPIDEPIKDKLDKSINIEYIKRNAKASAKSGNDIKDCGGSGNQTFGPGANLKNATIVNLSDNKGATSVCTK
ncbi:MAG: hypothetical protein E6Q61_09290 [Nitrosomonas sp.]|nr:MAG: hypothetical protein E6Q61_09290 [Nitrosomonas sp.]